MHRHILLPRYLRALISAILLGFLALILPAAQLHAAGVIYVVPGGAGAQTGIDWASAKDLQAALQGAASGDEIWVAAGVYKPTTGSDRTATFQLKSGVALYGGFAGAELGRDQRDPATQISILNGDLLGNDTGVVTSTNTTRSENSYHVVKGNSAAATAILDGFTITGGNANAGSFDMQGGGLLNVQGSPVLRNLIFTRNSAALAGGGMFNYISSNPTIYDSSFIDNAAGDDGGGLSTSGNGGFTSSITLSRVRFSGNTAPFGGGMFGNTSDVIMNRAIFQGNSATVGGGILTNFGHTTIAQSLFDGNTADTYGSAMAYYHVNATVSQVTLSANWSKNNGGALVNQESSPLIHNSIFWGNQGGQIYNYLSGNAPDVQYSLVQGGYINGTHILDADPLFVDADGADNIAGTPDDDLRLQAGSPVIDAGSNAFIPADLTDDNTNGNLSEPAPFDLAGNPRLDGTIVDLGTYEAHINVHITSVPPPAGTYGSSYSHTFTASAVLPVTYNVTAGNLPPGLALNATTGLLSGTPTSAGSYSGITVTASNTDGSASQTFTIVIDPAALTASADSKGKVYGAVNPSLTASYAGFVSGDTATVLSGSPNCTTSSTIASGVGTYPIHCTLGTLVAANYSFTFIDGALDVSPAALTITANNKVKHIGTANPALTVSYSGFVNNDTPASLDTPVSLATTATITSPPGTYPITVSAAADANYMISFVSGTLTVTSKLVTTITWAAPQAITYGTALGPAQLNASSAISGTFSYTPAAGTTLNCGNSQALLLTFTPDDSATYEVVESATSINVQPAALTITAENKTRAFGTANPPLTASYSGFVNGDTPASLDAPLILTTTATSASPPGMYIITASGAADTNYAITFENATLTIGRRRTYLALVSR